MTKQPYRQIYSLVQYKQRPKQNNQTQTSVEFKQVNMHCANKQDV